MANKVKLDTKWIKNAKDEKEAQAIYDQLLNSVGAFRRFRKIMEEMEASVDSKEKSQTVYDTPNWDYKQAHFNGYREAVRDLKKLLRFIDDDS